MVLGPEAGPPEPRLPDPREPAPRTDWIHERTVGKAPLQWRRRARIGWWLLVVSGLLFLLAIWTPGDNSGRWAGTATLVLALAIVVLISALILYDDGD